MIVFSSRIIVILKKKSTTVCLEREIINGDIFLLL